MFFEMDFQDEFRIPIRGLPDGESQHEYAWTERFLEAFEPKDTVKGSFAAKVKATKKPSMIQLDIHIEADVEVPCDACLEWIPLQAVGDYELICKASEVPEGDPILVQIHEEQSHLDLSPYFYEFSLLSLPMQRRIDCHEMDPAPCNFDILDKMQGDDADSPRENPFSELKDIFGKEDNV